MQRFALYTVKLMQKNAINIAYFLQHFLQNVCTRFTRLEANLLHKFMQIYCKPINFKICQYELILVNYCIIAKKLQNYLYILLQTRCKQMFRISNGKTYFLHIFCTFVIAFSCKYLAKKNIEKWCCPLWNCWYWFLIMFTKIQLFLQKKCILPRKSCAKLLQNLDFWDFWGWMEISTK